MEREQESRRLTRTGHAGRQHPVARVRRSAATTVAVLACVGLSNPILSTAADAAPSPSASRGSKVCTIGDQNLNALSGLTATKNGYAVVNNTGGSSMVVYLLDRHSCQVKSQRIDARPPYAPQDLGSTPDGTLWVSDTGDKDSQRDTVALWRFKPGEDQATLFRLTYPADAGKPDAKALLMQPDGTPILVTFEPGKGRLFRPTGPLDPNAPTPMKQVGQISVAATGTPGGAVGPIGQRVFTGGAVSPDGKRVVLRTYTDAYEWTVSGGDIAATITKKTPRRTPLPQEPAGEAITYSADGSSFLTVSDTENVTAQPSITRYQPAAAPAKTHKAKQPSGSGSGGPALSMSTITTGVIGVGVLGLILVLVGVFGIRRSRRSGATGASPSGGGPPADAETVMLPRVSDRHGPPPQGRGGREGPSPSRPRPGGRRPIDPSDAETAMLDRISDDGPPRGRRRTDSSWDDRPREDRPREDRPPARRPPAHRSPPEPPDYRHDGHQGGGIDWLDDEPYPPPRRRREPPDHDYRPDQSHRRLY